jgi:hypothetical protein
VEGMTSFDLLGSHVGSAGSVPDRPWHVGRCTGTARGLDACQSPSPLIPLPRAGGGGELPPPSVREEGQGGGQAGSVSGDRLPKLMPKAGLRSAAEARRHRPWVSVGSREGLERATLPLDPPPASGRGREAPSSLCEGGGSGWRVWIPSTCLVRTRGRQARCRIGLGTSADAPAQREAWTHANRPPP